jgi:putative DNA primase/helicase
LGITHFSKGTTGRDPLERVTGSIAFGALARIVLATCKMEGADLPEGTRLFARSKSNIGPDTGGFTYRLEQTMLEAFPDVAASAVLWGEAVEGTARELMAEADGGDDEGGAALTDAKDFLTEELRSGAVSAKKLISEARRHGISERTLKRAKAALKIKSEKKVDSWFWQFTNQVGHEGCHSKSLASLASLASLDDPQTLINTEGCQECQEIQSGTGGTLDGNLEVIEW